MNIQVGDLFRIKRTGEIMEIAGEWGKEYRQNSYKANGYPDCGINGQHNTAVDIVKWYNEGGLERIKPLPTKRALIRTFNYGNYYGKRFVVDKVEVIPDD